MRGYLIAIFVFGALLGLFLTLNQSSDNVSGTVTMEDCYVNNEPCTCTPEHCICGERVVEPSVCNDKA